MQRREEHPHNGIQRNRKGTPGSTLWAFALMQLNWWMQ